MKDAMSDADLLTSLDAVQALYLVADGAEPSLPTLAENRDALRLFNSIADAGLRDAVLSLLRILAYPADETAASAPNGHTRPAANRPG